MKDSPGKNPSLSSSNHDNEEVVRWTNWKSRAGHFILRLTEIAGSRSGSEIRIPILRSHWPAVKEVTVPSLAPAHHLLHSCKRESRGASGPFSFWSVQIAPVNAPAYLEMLLSEVTPLEGEDLTRAHAFENGEPTNQPLTEIESGEQ